MPGCTLDHKHSRRVFLAGVTALLLGVVHLSGPTARADHESSNQLTFAAVADPPISAATGSGLIEFHGGREPDSRWTSTFAFTGLTPDTAYTVVVRGRAGEDGSAEAATFAAICGFTSLADGTGGCWDYSLGMRRVGVVQLRAGGVDGSPVLAASRADGPGSIVSAPNFFSPAPTAPAGATPAASPVATPIASPAALSIVSHATA